MKGQHISYRLNRARETYSDALLLFEKKSYNSSINRLYYAAFYATIALLLSRGIEIKSHTGVKQKLGKEFVLKNLISKDMAKIYSLLADYRHKGDYDDLFDFDPVVVSRLISPVKEYIDRIEELIVQKGKGEGR
ncbi:MAG: HEPN domain-containing protein [Prolixibacteraceae bacterium]|nr:HEPN domain-containing protein [Prolixibacteraceae bacterium]